jgi:hypothetical protein
LPCLSERAGFATLARHLAFRLKALVAGVPLGAQVATSGREPAPALRERGTERSLLATAGGARPPPTLATHPRGLPRLPWIPSPCGVRLPSCRGRPCAVRSRLSCEAASASRAKRQAGKRPAGCCISSAARAFEELVGTPGSLREQERCPGRGPAPGRPLTLARRLAAGRSPQPICSATSTMIPSGKSTLPSRDWHRCQDAKLEQLVKIDARY